MNKPIGSGAVPLSSAIEALRDELVTAFYRGQPSWLKFKPSSVELTLQVAATSTLGGGGGIKWWLLDASVEKSKSLVATQTLKLTLEPTALDPHGQPFDVLIDSAEEHEAEDNDDIVARE